MRSLVFLLTLVLMAVLPGCDEQPAATVTPKQSPPPPVTVAKPLKKHITEWDEFTGRFQAVETVDVRARVSGFLEKTHFRDGQIVKKGDLLFTIDKRPFQIAVEQATAQVDQAQAQLDLANSDVERARPLLERRTITGREFESREATARGALASLSAARAQLRNAQLNLEWTEVTSPIAGRISDTPVDVGNLISGGQNGATVLTRIVSLDPIHFEFEGSEADYLKYMRLARSGQRPSSRDRANPVAVRLIDESDFRHRGKMDFVDNALDPKSGTIKGRAIFDNRDSLLLPGMFGRLRVFGGEFDAILIPDDAIASDQARKIVMSVTSDGSVTPKVVTLGPIIDGLRVIRSGLSENDQIIISGVQRARPGQKVKPELGKITAGTPQAN
ncbi:MAG: efflux RND transporter periplasmic adaptor subunit [Hyphomicrobiaceae bacterium]|nr:efflux RND transporter periplasmic adaptor subunit [Hyphomicrobiaceae bacterium]